MFTKLVELVDKYGGEAVYYRTITCDALEIQRLREKAEGKGVELAVRSLHDISDLDRFLDQL